MSASTMRATVRLGETALAQLREAENRMRAERESRAQEEITAQAAQLTRMQVADSKAFAGLAARCIALQGTLSSAEVNREHAAIIEEARKGDRAAAAQRVRQLEQRANSVYTTAVSQRLVTDAILGRAGAQFVGSARNGSAIQGKLDLGDGQAVPLTITSKQPAGNGGPVEHEVVFENDRSGIPKCEDQEEAVRRIAKAAGPELQLEDPREQGDQARRRRRKKAKAQRAKKTRRAG